jgi:hypothetical protein
MDLFIHNRADKPAPDIRHAASGAITATSYYPKSREHSEHAPQRNEGRIAEHRPLVLCELRVARRSNPGYTPLPFRLPVPRRCGAA